MRSAWWCRPRRSLRAVKAWILDESPGVYRFGEVATPEPGRGQVRVRVVTSALNHIDHWLTRGRPRPRSFPHVPGSDGAGIIDAVGPEVTAWAPGDEVVVSTAVTSDEAVARLGIDSVLDPTLELVGEHRWGVHGGYVVVPAAAVLAKPETMDWVTAAAYPCAFGTAWRMIRRGRVTAHDRVLITGISGGVATAALQLCRHLGADVHVTSRDPAKLALAAGLGASRGFDSGGPFDPVDVILDSIGPVIWDQSIAALSPGGRFVSCGGTSGQTLTVDLPKLFFRQHELIGSTLASYDEFAVVTQIVASGVLPVVDAVVDLADYPTALERLRNGAHLGKIVLDHAASGNGGTSADQ